MASSSQAQENAFVETPEIGDFVEFDNDTCWSRLVVVNNDESNGLTAVVIEALTKLHQMKTKFEKEQAGLHRFYCQRHRLVQLLDVWRNYAHDARVVELTCDVLCCLAKWGLWIEDTTTTDTTTTSDQQQQRRSSEVDRSRFLAEHGYIEQAIDTMQRHKASPDVQLAATSLLVYWCYRDPEVRKEAPARRIVRASLACLRDHPGHLELASNVFQLFGDFLVSYPPTDLIDGNGCMELLEAFDRHRLPCVLGHAWFFCLRRCAQNEQLRTAMVDLGGIELLRSGAVVVATNANPPQNNSFMFRRRVCSLLKLLENEWQMRQERVDQCLARQDANGPEVMLQYILARESDSASALFYATRATTAVVTVVVTEGR